MKYSILFALICCILFTLFVIHSTRWNQLFFSKVDKIKDMNVVVSGASSGIGLALVKELLRIKANVVCLMRRSEHAEENYNMLKESYGDSIKWIEVDFKSLKSIQNAVESIKTTYKDGVDVLFNNAGVSNTATVLSEDGFVEQIQSNCISHVALTEGILPYVEKRKGVIINHSSLSYTIPPATYNPIFFKKYTNVNEIYKQGNSFYNKFFMSQQLYQQSKLSLILYSHSLQSRLKDKHVRVISFHPGICKTNLFKCSILPRLVVEIIDAFSAHPRDIVPYLVESIVSDLKVDQHVIYGPTHIHVNPNMVNCTHVQQFHDDVVSQFIAT